MLFRMLLWGVITYLVWKVIQAFAAPSQRGPRRTPPPPQSPPAAPPKTFSDIKDAEFEEIPSKKGE
jgi:hypothetical protein